MDFNVITIFPSLIKNYSEESILGRGQKKKIIKINSINLRDFTQDKHKSVDDTPYGGGAGMVMKPEPIYQALKSLKADSLQKKGLTNTIKKVFNKKVKQKTILLSPRGKQFDQKMAKDFANLDKLNLVCGRYEGVDQRVTDHMIDEEVSIGAYVLAGGELGALVIIEAVSRLIPGVLGNPDSLLEETHTLDLAEYAQYTKPADFNGWQVPKILLSGNHEKIKKWRHGQSKQDSKNS